MDILAALSQSQAKAAPTPQHDYIKDGVWEATLFRLGKDIKDYEGVPYEDREAILTMLEKKND